MNFKGLRRLHRDGAPPAELFDESIDVAGEGLIVSGMAGRYATALFELALEQHAIDAVRADLDRFDALLDESSDLLRLVRSPVFTADEQLKSLSAMLDKAGITGIAANFLKVVTANRRLFTAREMIRGYRQLVARHKDEVTAEVTLAEKPNDAHLPRSRARSRPSPRRTCRSTSKSIPRSSAG